MDLAEVSTFVCPPEPPVADTLDHHMTSVPCIGINSAPGSETYGHSWSPDPTSLVVRPMASSLYHSAPGYPHQNLLGISRVLAEEGLSLPPRAARAVLVRQMIKPSYFGTRGAGRKTPHALTASASLSLKNGWHPFARADSALEGRRLLTSPRRAS